MTRSLSSLVSHLDMMWRMQSSSTCQGIIMMDRRRLTGRLRLKRTVLPVSVMHTRAVSLSAHWQALTLSAPELLLPVLPPARAPP